MPFLEKDRFRPTSRHFVWASRFGDVFFSSKSPGNAAHSKFMFPRWCYRVLGGGSKGRGFPNIPLGLATSLQVQSTK